MPSKVPSEEEVIGWTESLKNWGRWGPDDELGTANLITPEKRIQAARLVSEGKTVSCARQIKYEMEPFTDPRPVSNPTRHFMLHSGEGHAHATTPWTFASDTFQIAPHGTAMTHLDALCHALWKGYMYNGRPAHLISTHEGAVFASIEAAGSGVSTRGVLLDIAALKGVGWLEPGTPVHKDDLLEAEERQRVNVEPGDILFVRTGEVQNRMVSERSGLHADCLPFLHERGVAMLGCDSPNDTFPSGYKVVSVPIHIVGIHSMGLWLIDNCIHEELAEACRALGRWAFQVTLAPLKLKHATGCPVNPVVLL